MIRFSDQRRGPLGNAIHRVKRGMFALISRVGMAAYSHFPVFGSLRASVGLIRNGDLVLVIERSDGRGLSLPGGLSFLWESAERTLVREVFEETGLLVKRSDLLFEYHAATELPCNISVFAVEAQGELTDSWEGSPCWLPLIQTRARLIASQRAIVDKLTSSESSEASACTRPSDAGTR